MAKHHPDLIFCRKQPGVGEYQTYFNYKHFLEDSFLFDF